MSDNRRPPNLIVIMADQLRADALGYAGNPVVQTPNLDRLAGGGTSFDRAFVQCPVCMASRQALYTGRYPNTIRVRSMGMMPPTETTLPTTLRRSGYITGNFGKLHFTPQGYVWRELGGDKPILDAGQFLRPMGIDTAANRAALEDADVRNFGFDVDYGVEDMLWGHHFDWLEQNAPEHLAHQATENWGIGRAGFQFGEAPARRMWQPHVNDFFDSRLPGELHPSAFIVDKTLEFCRDNRERPFFAHCSFVDPHHPFNAPQPYNQMYPAGDMPIPEHLDYDAFYAGARPEGFNRKWQRHRGFPDGLWQWALANYYGMVSHIDWCVGRLLDGLEQLGLRDDTLIVFTADHGEYVGDHRLLYKGSLLIDGIIGVPLVFNWPGRIAGGRALPQMVQQIDVFPTVAALLGIAPPEGLQGIDLAPQLVGGDREGRGGSGELAMRRGVAPAHTQPEQRSPHAGQSHSGYEQVFCELDLLGDDTYVPSLAVRTDRWKLNYLPFARNGFLFDLQEDPRERHNLYHDPGRHAVRHELLLDLLDYYHRTKDWLPVRLSQA